MTTHCFLGPTMARSAARLISKSVLFHPPIAHGDLFRLGPRSGDTVIIIDGVYHQALPIRHKEILHFLDRGVGIVGAASMGALRAAELDRYGMRGVGTVYEMLRDGRINADDEVAVAHAPDGSHRPLTEPLINLRVALDRAHTDGLLAPAVCDDLLRLVRAIPYVDRTWARMVAETTAIGLGTALDSLRAAMQSRADRGDVKQADAITALRRTELAFGPAELPVPREAWASSHLQRWCAEFSPADDADPDSVGFGSVIDYHRLNDHSFPLLWRRIVLASMCRRDDPFTPPVAALERQALAIAGERGLAIDVEADADAQAAAAFWLSPGERDELAPREQAIRILVRSSRMEPAAALLPWRTHSFLAGRILAPEGIDRARASLAAVLPNVITSRGLTLRDLKDETIEGYLRLRWRLPAEAYPGAQRSTTLAAARDRGFADIPDAIHAARPFLAAHLKDLAGAHPGGAAV
ncbi:hypothetical protein ABH920_009947 [Catenulispora sp. EB89]|uniref:TfuA-like protein n=1 Tax=Catenulispora sp. EB89 TaxID=3156257 RepID=UPI003510FB6C